MFTELFLIEDTGEERTCEEKGRHEQRLAVLKCVRGQLSPAGVGYELCSGRKLGQGKGGKAW